MKKSIAAAIIIITLAAVLNGCGNKENSSSAVETTQASTTQEVTTQEPTTEPITTAPTTQPNSTEPNDHAVMEETFPEYTGSTSSEEETFYQGAVLEETFPPYTGPDVPMEEL
ncbi:MAG: hypothetical protein IJ598_02260, partial [Ruminococcus sp.]|nr:hypothetical protein [Ruminococcus sp.]